MSDDEDTIWALQEAARPSGFMPHAAGVVSFLKRLEMHGLLRRSTGLDIWYITDAVRARLEHAGNGEGA